MAESVKLLNAMSLRGSIFFVSLFYILASAFALISAGYEHVQQRPGVGAVGTSDEPVRFASGGRRRGKQRRSVFWKLCFIRKPEMFVL